MRKNLKEYFEQNGCKIEGNSACGVINGYRVNYSTAPLETNTVLFFSNYAAENDRQNIVDALKILEDKFTKYSFNVYGVTFLLNDWTGAKLAERIMRTIDTVCNVLTKNNAKGAEYCPICGKQLNDSEAQLRKIDGFYVAIDEECVNSLNERIEQSNQEFESAPNNYLKGFGGALIGGLAGVAVAVILNLIGFISAISSFVAFFVGILLYRKFGGKPNKMMLVIVTSTTFVCMVLSIIGIYVFVAGQAAVEQGANMSAFKAFSVCMQDEEFARYFYADLAMTILFSVLGCVFEIVKTARNIKRATKI